MTILESIGWSPFFAEQLAAHVVDDLVPLRVVEDFGRIVRLLGANGEIWGETSGKLRHRAAGVAALPAVGDWVLARPPAGDGRAVVERVLERRTRLSRKAAGERTTEQVVAANVDTMFVMQSMDGDCNVRRLERYLVVAREGGVEPVVLLTKADLCADSIELVERTRRVAPEARIEAVSTRNVGGLDAVLPFLVAGRTIALLGSSGVGKSTLLNALAGSGVARVAEVRDRDGRGRHTTTARRLRVLPGGAMLVNTPGMRELALWEGDEALADTFDELHDMARRCRFRDCGHEREPGCAVLEAAAEDPNVAARLSSWKKLHAELAHVARKTDAAQALAEKGRARQIQNELKRFYKSRG